MKANVGEESSGRFGAEKEPELSALLTCRAHAIMKEVGLSCGQMITVLPQGE